LCQSQTQKSGSKFIFPKSRYKAMLPGKKVEN